MMSPDFGADINAADTGTRWFRLTPQVEKHLPPAALPGGKLLKRLTNMF